MTHLDWGILMSKCRWLTGVNIYFYLHLCSIWHIGERIAIDTNTHHILRKQLYQNLIDSLATCNYKTNTKPYQVFEYKKCDLGYKRVAV